VTPIRCGGGGGRGRRGIHADEVHGVLAPDLMAPVTPRRMASGAGGARVLISPCFVPGSGRRRRYGVSHFWLGVSDQPGPGVDQIEPGSTAVRLPRQHDWQWAFPLALAALGYSARLVWDVRDWSSSPSRSSRSARGRAGFRARSAAPRPHAGPHRRAIRPDRVFAVRGSTPARTGRPLRESPGERHCCRSTSGAGRRSCRRTTSTEEPDQAE